MNKDKFKELVIKTRYLKGKALTKEEMKNIFDGMSAMEKLGAFDKDRFALGARKEVYYGKNRS